MSKFAYTTENECLTLEQKNCITSRIVKMKATLTILAIRLATIVAREQVDHPAEFTWLECRDVEGFADDGTFHSLRNTFFVIVTLANSAISVI